MNSLGLLLLLVAVAHAQMFDRVCKSNTECQSNECCQIMSDRLIASKRFVSFDKIPKASKSGTCKPYSVEGDSCSSFSKINGYCGCEPGTSCQTVKVSEVKTVFARSMVNLKPGYATQCVRIV